MPHFMQQTSIKPAKSAAIAAQKFGAAQLEKISAEAVRAGS
jgi:hypothetical protein